MGEWMDPFTFHWLAGDAAMAGLHRVNSAVGAQEVGQKDNGRMAGVLFRYIEPGKPYIRGCRHVAVELYTADAVSGWQDDDAAPEHATKAQEAAADAVQQADESLIVNNCGVGGP